MSKISAIVPAAGRSRRMGCPKPLLPIGDRPVLLRILADLLEEGVQPIVVVLRPDDQAALEAIAGFPVLVAWNCDPESEMAGSLRSGLTALDPGDQAILVWPADYPLVRRQTLRTLFRGCQSRPEQIILPTHEGKRGHPVLFPRPILEEIYALPTLRHVVRRDPGRICSLQVNDPGVLLDLDTPEDYRRLLALADARLPSPTGPE